MMSFRNGCGSFCFNVAAIAYLIFTNTLRWTTVSLSGCAIALSLIGGSAWLSARRYKNWK
jgi:hypothetical protein